MKLQLSQPAQQPPGEVARLIHFPVSLPIEPSGKGPSFSTGFCALLLRRTNNSVVKNILQKASLFPLSPSISLQIHALLCYFRRHISWRQRYEKEMSKKPHPVDKA